MNETENQKYSSAIKVIELFDDNSLFRTHRNVINYLTEESISLMSHQP